MLHFLCVILFVHYDDTISFVRFTYDDRVVLTEVALSNLLFFGKAKSVLLMLAVVIKCRFILRVKMHYFGFKFQPVVVFYKAEPNLLVEIFEFCLDIYGIQFIRKNSKLQTFF